MREPLAAAARRTPMRHRLGILLWSALLTAGLTAGCGSSNSSTAAQDPGTSSSPPAPGPSSPAGAKVHLISLTAAGGAPGPAAPLNTPEQVAAFTQQFPMQAMRNQIEAFTSRVGSGNDVQGAVIAVGCDRPPGAAVTVDANGEAIITPYDVESPLEECLAAVTTVGIAVIPQG
jgi:hypothetical protein